jgi:transcriptional regulator with XRE-family HTH domain
MNVTKRIGGIIKSKRLTLGLSQKDVSIKSFDNDYSNALISRIENGKHDQVRFETVYKILLALDIDLLDNL